VVQAWRIRLRTVMIASARSMNALITFSRRSSQRWSRLNVLCQAFVRWLDMPALTGRNGRLLALVRDLAGQPTFSERFAGLTRVVAGIQVHGDLVRKGAELVKQVKGGGQQGRVVTVGAGQDPAQGTAVALDEHRPLHALFAPIARGRSGYVTPPRSLPDAPINGRSDCRSTCCQRLRRVNGHLHLRALADPWAWAELASAGLTVLRMNRLLERTIDQVLVAQLLPAARTVEPLPPVAEPSPTPLAEPAADSVASIHDRPSAPFGHTVEVQLPRNTPPSTLVDGGRQPGGYSSRIFSALRSIFSRSFCVRLPAFSC
jgi:hypothetical protein